MSEFRWWRALQLAWQQGGRGLQPYPRLEFERIFQQTGTSGLLVLVAVNRLKFLNDQRGWAAGDALIRCIERALRQHLPRGTNLTRWSGDEFLLFVPTSSFEDINRILSGLQRQLASPFPDQPAFLFGLSHLNETQPFQEALNEADHALYLDKGEGAISAQRLGEERGLFNLSYQLVQMDSPEDIVTKGLHLVRCLLRFEAAAFAQVSEGHLVNQRLDHDPAVTFPDGVLDGRIRLSPLAQRAVQDHRTVVTLDAPNDPAASGIWDRLQGKSGMVTPVEVGGQAIGILWTMQITAYRAVPVRAQHLLELAAMRLAHVLELRQTVQAVRQTLEGGLLGLGVALEARDLESYGHTQRVVDASVQLGRALGLSSSALDDLRQGAYLHDIGKLSIPDRILLKPGRLDPDEWQVMQSHAATGASIAAHIPQLSPGALNVIRAHHERWDGAGYPSGLSGAEIPLLARIFAVCDVYDALTSKRVYKPAWTAQQAQEEIAQQAGKQFDPEVVQAFLTLVDGVRTAADDEHQGHTAQASEPKT
ncbi:HD domain-containing phosphohydrolase [Deinococcus arboris]|nr:HD domain-containing phosphohydrolase [Deinococcus arboris]